MMQNFYNKASAHNSLSNNYPKTSQNPRTQKPQKTPTKERKIKSLKQTTKSTSFQNNFHFHFVRKRGTKREREREREKGNAISYVQNGVFLFFFVFFGLFQEFACFNN
jgi:hypothetical protein